MSEEEDEIPLRWRVPCSGADRGRGGRWGDSNSASSRNEDACAGGRLAIDKPCPGINRRGAGKGIKDHLGVPSQVAVRRIRHINNIIGLEGNVLGFATDDIFV